MEKGDWRNKIFNGICLTAMAVGVLLIGRLLVFLIFREEHPGRLLSNGPLFLFVLAFDLAAGILYVLLHGKIKTISVRHPVLLLAGIYFVLYCVQVIVASHVYFYPTWDVGYMRYAVEQIINGSSMAECSADIVYASYPNNLFLFYLLYLMEKAGILFSMENPYLLCIYCSCLSVNISCFLAHLTVRRLVKSKMIQGLYMLLSVIAILSSPWSLVPYSDAFGMFFVMLSVWAIVCCDKKYLKWFLLAFASVMGYRIKPTALFPLFAVCIIYGAGFLLFFRKRWKEAAVLAGSVCGIALLSMCIPLWIQHTFSYRLAPEYRITYHHYLMMGLNEENSGAYNNEDYVFSSGQPDVETRIAADMEVYRDRRDTLKAEGKLKELLINKALVNFNDGCWDWYTEGAVHVGLEVPHDNAIFNIYKKFTHYEDEYFFFYMTLLHGIWLQMLFGILFVPFFAWKEHTAEKACMITMLCGLIVFLMIFEARARYLYLYSPVFLILALCGLGAVYEKTAEWVLRRKNR